MIDILKYTRSLEEAGFDRKQAELFVQEQFTPLRSEMNEMAPPYLCKMYN